MFTSPRGTPRRRAIAVAGDRVGRRDDRAEHERRRPREPVDDRVRDDRDADRRHDDEPDREEPDRARVGSQVAERREERRAVEQRRQDAEEDELRLELELGNARDDANGEPADDEQDRVRDTKRRRAREQRGDDRQKPERDEAVGEVEVHAAIFPHGCPTSVGHLQCSATMSSARPRSLS